MTVGDGSSGGGDSKEEDEGAGTVRIELDIGKGNVGVCWYETGEGWCKLDIFMSGTLFKAKFGAFGSFV